MGEEETPDPRDPSVPGARFLPRFAYTATDRYDVEAIRRRHAERRAALDETTLGGTAPAGSRPSFRDSPTGPTPSFQDAPAGSAVPPLSGVRSPRDGPSPDDGSHAAAAQAPGTHTTGSESGSELGIGSGEAEPRGRSAATRRGTVVLVTLALVLFVLFAVVSLAASTAVLGGLEAPWSDASPASTVTATATATSTSAVPAAGR